MFYLKKIDTKGKISTVFKYAYLKTVKAYLHHIILENPDFKVIAENHTFSNGAKGAIVAKKNGDILQYFYH